MSEERIIIKNTGRCDVELQITSFYGGNERGVMLQLTQGFSSNRNEPGFIQLTHRDAIKVVSELSAWLKEG